MLALGPAPAPAFDLCTHGGDVRWKSVFLFSGSARGISFGIGVERLAFFLTPGVR